MQFISNGPEIPEKLLQDHEDGNVIFFCGAGVSYPAGLPDFKGLVDRIVNELRIEKSNIENESYSQEQFDTVIGLIEQRVPGNRKALRRTLPIILSEQNIDPSSLITHKSLLRLSKNKHDQHRLITTNYDRLFEKASNELDFNINRYIAPILPPLPKNDLDGIIYLHGLISENPLESELDNLILSSGDFGLAYLVDRWASKFVSRLFERFTVCFVGYSIKDSVIRYMMDALAADKARGESSYTAFAFGGYKNGQKEIEKNRWMAKNVIPILYDDIDNHKYLHRTLEEWSKIYEDGVVGKERIIEQNASQEPVKSTKEDNFVGKVLWALSDPSGLPAKRFATLEPLPPIEWLFEIEKNGLLASNIWSTQGIKNNPNEYSCITQNECMKFTLSQEMFINRGNLSEKNQVLLQLTNWLINYYDDPKLVIWILKHESMINDKFKYLVYQKLKDVENAENSIIWNLVLLEKLKVNLPYFYYENAFSFFEKISDDISPIQKLKFLKLMKPIIILRKSFNYYSDKENVKESLKDSFDVEIEFMMQGVSALRNKINRDIYNVNLYQLLSDLSCILHEIFIIFEAFGMAHKKYDMSHIDIPSIKPHKQNRGHHDWTLVLELLRESWKSALKKDKQLAINELEKWNTIRFPIFKRLVFYSCTFVNVVSVAKTLSFLLSDECWWLWSVSTRREVLQLLKVLITQTKNNQNERLEKKILLGPPRKMYNDDLSDDRFELISNREILIRLIRIQTNSGYILKETNEKFRELIKLFPNHKKYSDEREEFSSWVESSIGTRKFTRLPREENELIEAIRNNPTKSSYDDIDDWRDICESEILLASNVLTILAEKGEWFNDWWREALQVWMRDDKKKKSWEMVSDVLLKNLARIENTMLDSYSAWLLENAKLIEDEDEEKFLTMIKFCLEKSKKEEFHKGFDRHNDAINYYTGKATEAFFNRWFEKPLEDNQKIQPNYREILVIMCDNSFPALRYSRVFLGIHAITLFRIDREWTIKHILPLFDWSSSKEEALTIWSGYLLGQRFYLPIIESIKVSVLDASKYYEDLGAVHLRYINFLVNLSVFQYEIFTAQELSVVTKNLPLSALESISGLIAGSLKNTSEKRREFWQNRIKPYLLTIWPNDLIDVSDDLIKNFALICVYADENFEEAFQIFEHYFKPLNNSNKITYALSKTNICTMFPSKSLEFLDKILEEEFPINACDQISKCLGKMSTEIPDISRDRRFMRINEQLRYYK